MRQTVGEHTRLAKKLASSDSAPAVGQAVKTAYVLINTAESSDEEADEAAHTALIECLTPRGA